MKPSLFILCCLICLVILFFDPKLNQNNNGKRVHPPKPRGYDGSILRRALIDRNERTALYELEHGATLKNEDGSMAASIVEHTGKASDLVLEKILDKGFDPNTAFSGSTLLSKAVERPHHESTIHMLIRRGANKNAMSWRGTVLHVAVLSGRNDSIKALLAEHVDLNRVDVRGDTALHVAAKTSNIEALKLLVQAGADKSIRNRDGFTPLDIVGDISGLFSAKAGHDAR